MSEPISVDHGRVVSSHHLPKDDDGGVIDAVDHSRMVYLNEFDSLVPSLGRELVDPEVCDEANAVVVPAEGDDDRRDGQRQSDRRSERPKDMDLQVGMQLRNTEGTDVRATMLRTGEVEEARITATTNHPLASQTLHLQANVTGSRTAPERSSRPGSSANTGPGAAVAADEPAPSRLIGWPLAAYAMACALLSAGILWLNDGVFSYTLDDPYIHLELARHLSLGEHGINDGEFAAPSSSVLWPLLLVPAWWTGGAFWAPLSMNLASSTLAVGALAAMAARVAGPDVPLGRVRPFLLPLLLVANVVALTFSGMEHTLQVALAAWLAVGLVDVARGRGVSWWLVATLVALPLLRFEDTGIVLLAAGWLVVRGHRAVGLGVGATVVGALGAYVAWLHAQSGFWLPFSVLSKNDMGTPAWQEAYQAAVFVPVLLTAWALWRTRERTVDERWLPGIALAADLGHVALAQVGYFNRYLGYITVFSVLIVAWSERDAIRGALRGGGEGLRILWLVTLIVATLNAKNTLVLPWASAHIWRQQGQMHVIATEVVDGAVAVNDIGWVSLENPHYVVDLVGLASAEALKHRLDSDAEYEGASWMSKIVEDHDAKAILIFRHWFERLPPSWQRVATLVVHPDYSVYQDTAQRVLILARSRSEAETLRAGLEAFAPRLPRGVTLEWAEGQ